MSPTRWPLRPTPRSRRLIQLVGVPRAVDMAVKLGLRSYALPGHAPATTTRTATRAWPTSSSGRTSGSFTLGPFELNALELSNVAATLASGGTWCPPNPIDKSDRPQRATQVSVTTETCDQVVPEGLANTLANAMSKDAPGRRYRGRLGRRGRMESAGLRARPAPPRRTGHRASSASPASTRRPTTSTTTPARRRTCAPRRCASAVAATSTAATSRPAPGSPR